MIKVIDFLKGLVDDFRLVLENLQNPYEQCYNRMEDSGIAVFGMCSGLTGGTSATEYLSESCIGCPHFTFDPVSKDYKPKIIAVDFDGTLCKNNYPEIGEPNYLIIDRLKEHQKQGDKLILWTCRVDAQLKEALDWCMNYDINFDSVNENLPEIIESFGTNSRKIFANEYWDDRNMYIDYLLSEEKIMIKFEEADK